MKRNPDVDWSKVDDVYYGCVNQAGEDNRNVARMALLLAGLSPEVPGATVNRLCASGMEAVNSAARAIRSNEGNLFIAGGSESMSRAPFVMAKAKLPLHVQLRFTTQQLDGVLLIPSSMDSMVQTQCRKRGERCRKISNKKRGPR